MNAQKKSMTFLKMSDDWNFLSASHSTQASYFGGYAINYEMLQPYNFFKCSKCDNIAFPGIIVKGASSFVSVISTKRSLQYSKTANCALFKHNTSTLVLSLHLNCTGLAMLMFFACTANMHVVEKKSFKFQKATFYACIFILLLLRFVWFRSWFDFIYFF